MDEIIQEIYETQAHLNHSLVDARKIAEQINRGTGGREVALAITKLQEAKMWLKQAVEEIDAAAHPTTGETNNG